MQRLILLSIFLEGPLRKWIFPSLQQVLYFQTIAVLVILGVLKWRELDKRLLGPLLVYELIILAVFQIKILFDPKIMENPDIVLLVLVLYCVTPLLIIEFSSCTIKQFIDECYASLKWAGLINCVVMLLQFNAPLDSWLNSGDYFLAPTAGDGKTRAIGIFSNSFLTSNFITMYLMVGMLKFLHDKSNFSFRKLATFFLIGLAMTLLSISRSTLYTVVPYIGGFLFLTRRGLNWRVIASFIIAIALLSWILSEPIETFLMRISEAGESENAEFGFLSLGRILFNLYAFLGYLDVSHPFGIGLGLSTSPGLVRDLASNYGFKNPWGYGNFGEDALSSSVIDFGYIGLVIALVRIASVFFMCFDLFSTRERIKFSTKYIVYAPCAIAIVSQAVFVSLTAAVFVWIWFGLALGISRGQSNEITVARGYRELRTVSRSLDS